MKKIMQPCGLHCIKMQDIGVTIGEQNILQHVNLHIHCGTLAAVIGKNGAGKSTLIRAILGDIPHTGTIEFKNRENGHMQKMRIGYVPQSLNIEKKTPISVYDMIAPRPSLTAPIVRYRNGRFINEWREYRPNLTKRSFLIAWFMCD